MELIIYNASANIDLPKSKQSANTLFHFMTELEYLESILKKQKLYPRYCKENYTFVDDDFPSLIYPMKCFCDIYLEKINLHCEDYGSFGIGFHKNEFIKKNIQPVQYINDKSSLAEVYNNQSLSYISEYGSDVNDNFYNDRFFKQLRFMKPLFANVTNQKKKEYKKCMSDEQEWRYVPDYEQFNHVLPFLNPISSQDDIKDSSNQIEKEDELYLEFNYEEIKYLLVDTKKNSDLLIDFIYSNISDSNGKLKLISKIIVLKDLMEDM